MQSTGVPRALESATPQDPTVGLGPFDGPSGVARFYERDTPVHVERASRAVLTRAHAWDAGRPRFENQNKMWDAENVKVDVKKNEGGNDMVSVFPETASYTAALQSYKGASLRGNRQSPRITIGPLAWAFCRVQGGACFL